MNAFEYILKKSSSKEAKKFFAKSPHGHNGLMVWVEEEGTYLFLSNDIINNWELKSRSYSYELYKEITKAIDVFSFTSGYWVAPEEATLRYYEFLSSGQKKVTIRFTEKRR